MATEDKLRASRVMMTLARFRHNLLVKGSGVSNHRDVERGSDMIRKYSTASFYMVR